MNERILGGTGIRPDWDEIWMDMAKVIGQRSKCDRDKVGAVIVPLGNHQGAIPSYNGPPYGFPAEGSCRNWCQRTQSILLRTDYSDCPAAHAEANAITRADFSKIQGGTIYASSSVCFNCAKLVANSGIKRVVMHVDYSQEHRNPKMSIDFLLTSGLGVEVWTTGLGVPRKRLKYETGQNATEPIEIGSYGSQLAW